MARRLVPLLLAALLTTAGFTDAQDSRDARLADDISTTLNTHPALTIFDDVSVQVQNGSVTLTGKVTSDYKKEDVARAAAKMDGVREIRNFISVLPASASDDELRYRVSRAIYTNAAFWTYASMPRPPIHVIVEQGRVTLTGVVASDSERTLARSLATGLGEVSVTNELRTEVRELTRSVKLRSR